ncbi:MAG: FG-GAP repeat domain-containing protein [Pirellulaceae bacterium]
MISGSYDPGELYLFRGLGGGKFAAREVICDKSGKPIVKVPNQKDPVESFGSWMTLVDWDDDGDLDVLVGTFEGMMFLRRNEGNRTQPEYATENEWVMVGQKRLRVPGGEHATPVTADWNGDGRWDILTGNASGGVYWYRNVGEKCRPEFVPPIALVPKHEGIGYSELLDVGQEPRPGIRSQIAVTDYDGDGKLDILVGDFCTYLHVKESLTSEQRRQFKATQARQQAAAEQLRSSMDTLRERWQEMMKDVPKSEWHTPEHSDTWQKMYQKMQDSPAYKEHRNAYDQEVATTMWFELPASRRADRSRWVLIFLTSRFGLSASSTFPCRTMILRNWRTTRISRWVISTMRF